MMPSGLGRRFTLPGHWRRFEGPSHKGGILLPTDISQPQTAATARMADLHGEKLARVERARRGLCCAVLTPLPAHQLKVPASHAKLYVERMPCSAARRFTCTRGTRAHRELSMCALRTSTDACMLARCCSLCAASTASMLRLARTSQVHITLLQRCPLCGTARQRRWARCSRRRASSRAVWTRRESYSPRPPVCKRVCLCARVCVMGRAREGREGRRGEGGEGRRGEERALARGQCLLCW